MYFPIGWPTVLRSPRLDEKTIKQVTCNQEKLLAILSDDCLTIWFCKPSLPIVSHRRTLNSLLKSGDNSLVKWKEDSSMLVVVTLKSHLLLYNLSVLLNNKQGVYVPTNLKTTNEEFFMKETVPALHLSLNQEIICGEELTSIACISNVEFMVATTKGDILRFTWEGIQNALYNLNLQEVSVGIAHKGLKSFPLLQENTHVLTMEYSFQMCGFSLVLSDGRAAFLKFIPPEFNSDEVQWIWAEDLDDATCSAINCKYRLIAYGRKNSECSVYQVDKIVGNLKFSHHCTISSKDDSCCHDMISQVKWTCDGCALVTSWARGGIALWSTFGALLTCSLSWNYDSRVYLEKFEILQVTSIEWSPEGYHLWMVQKCCFESENKEEKNINSKTKFRVIKMNFVKSALTTNTCMIHQNHTILQGSDRLYISSISNKDKTFSNLGEKENGLWLVIPISLTYLTTNWPIMYVAIDKAGENVAVAGKLGLAYFCITTNKWKMFGNETQEKDFLVTAGLFWWKNYMVMGCYNIIDQTDEIRFYSKDCKMDDKFAICYQLSAPILIMNNFEDQFITFGCDGKVTIWMMEVDLDPMV